MKKKNLTANYASLQLFYWIAFATVSAFSSAYLLDAGLTSGTIGVIIAVGGVVSTILQPIIAAYADRPDSASLREIMIVGGLISFLIGLGLAVNNERSVVCCIVLYLLQITVLQTVQPLVNAISMACLNQGYSLNFGAARAFGSVGYAALAWALGKLVAVYGAWLIPVSMILCYGFFTILTFVFPFKKETVSEQKQNTAQANQISDSPAAFFSRHKRFGIVLIGLVLMHISHVLLNNFTLQIVTVKGGGSAEMGTGTAIAAMVELPVMFLFSYIVKKVKSHVLFRISPVFFFLKIFGTLLVSGIPAFYAVQVFQMFGWALYSVAVVYYVNELMDERDAVKGQAYTTMAYSVACVIASILGGWMIDALGVGKMLLFGSIASGIGALIILLAADRTEH